MNILKYILYKFNNILYLNQDIINLEQAMYSLHGKNNDNYLNIFYTTWRIIPCKKLYLSFILISEIIRTLGIFGLILQSKFIIIISPIIIIIINTIRDRYFIELSYKTRFIFRKLVYDYFDNLSYKQRKSYENMTDFHDMVDRTANIICSIMDWGIPTLIRLITISFTCFTVFYIKGYIFLLPLITFIYTIFYYLYINKKLNTILLIRDNKRIARKKYTPIKKWLLHLFQNRKRNIYHLLSNNLKIDNLDKQFEIEWFSINKKINLIPIIISTIGLYLVNDFFTLIIIKVIFDNFTNVVRLVSNFIKNFTNNMKDFDKFLSWYNDSQGREIQFINTNIITFPIYITNVKINYTHFTLNSTQLVINKYDKILLKGKTGSGKTELVNALQGLSYGANIKQIDDPRTLQHNIEYMNQHIRETIPSNGITLRTLLENENNDHLIKTLLKVVILDDKFNNQNYDNFIQDLSGGEKMKLSLLFTLLETINKKKQILILDEPEQGLDQLSRCQIITNILNYLHIPVLCIYHGSSLDLLKMPFNKIWLFDHKNKNTQVYETNFKDYQNKFIDEINEEIKKIK